MALKRKVALELDILEWRKSIEDGEFFDHRDILFLLEIIEDLRNRYRSILDDLSNILENQ